MSKEHHRLKTKDRQTLPDEKTKRQRKIEEQDKKEQNVGC